MDQINIRLMKDRDYQMIPVDQIVVTRSRWRGKRQFEENVRSIDQLGLYKPIQVNKRNFARTGKYELICGEGRLAACKQLGKTEIKCDIWDVDEKQALLMTLGENLTRTPLGTIVYARILKEMHDFGATYETLSQTAGKSVEYLQKYICLMEQGEERLIKGVEDGVFPIKFAIEAAQSSERSVQHLLMDAFDNAVITCGNLARVRRIIEDRLQKGKEYTKGGKRNPSGSYTLDKLKGDIRQMTRQKEAFVHEAGLKENRLMHVLIALKQLHADANFNKLLQSEGLAELPELKGKYTV